MASQHVLFEETVAAMNKAFKRKAYESDSDSDVDNHGNRSNKLKKGARFARQGQLLPSQGPSAYREVVDFAGSQRAIIYRNPPLVGEEGYELESDDGDDGGDESVQEATLKAAEFNPYANLRIERILAPLTAATDLPTHSTLSKPFLSNTLTNLVSQSCELSRRENRSLWRVRHLWTSLYGDGTWMPCGLMVGPDDVKLYTDDHVAHFLQSLAGQGGQEASASDALTGRTGEMQGDVEVAQDAKAPSAGDAKAPGANDAKPGLEAATAERGPNGTDTSDARHVDGARTSGSLPGTGKEAYDGTNKSKRENKATQKDRGPGATPQAEGEEEPRASKTAETNTGAGFEQGRRSVQSEASEPTFIHPMFKSPTGASLDRNLGLPEHEAEDIRRLLALYVQKQEEICRGATRLHHGLLRAERLRKEVLHWSKAEAHCGPNRDMSDGEDWYDKEEWGLTEDLKKGQDEEEEDTATAGKKTRNRR